MLGSAPPDEPRDADAPRNPEIVADGFEPLNRPRAGDAPDGRLDPRVIAVWRIEAAVTAAVLVAVTAGGGYVGRRLGLPATLAALPAVAALIYGGVEVLLFPRLRWRNWRYAVGATEVDLQHGFVTTTRTRVPMARIQHVDTRRGPLERRYGLATLVLYTAAGSRAVPGLALASAEATRDRIAALANVRDDV